MPKTIQVSVNDLLFDPDNPRLPKDIARDQGKIFRYLSEEIGVEDLLSAMGVSGFVEADPIIVKTTPSKGAKRIQYYVVEGNRRLAAIKTIIGQKFNDGKPGPDTPEVEEGVIDSLQSIPVQIDWEPKALEAYLGYKHVTATREWSPEAKARFVYKTANGDLSNDNLRLYARQFGTNLPTLKRWLVAMLVLDQAEAKEIFDPKKSYTNRYFGTFYTLLTSPVIQDFIGLKTEGNLKTTPVPPSKIKQLGELLSWTVGTQTKPPVVNSRIQKKFETILSSPRALQYFRERRDVESALLYTEFTVDEICSVFRNATYTLNDTMRRLYDVRNDEHVLEAFNELKQALNEVERTLRG